MSRSLVLAFLSILLVSTAVLPAQNQVLDHEDIYIRSVKKLRWADPNSQPGTYADYLKARALRGNLVDALFNATLDYRSAAPLYQSGTRFDVLVDATLEPSIKSSMAQYIKDIEAEGWAVSVYKCTGGTPPEVRAFLQGRYTKDKILGCMIVGDLPAAWYEIISSSSTDSFPSDIYYMDLNGSFGDQDNNGRFDSHSATANGDQKPDIWVGRLTAGTLAGIWGTEAALVNHYFTKIHEYRVGKLTAPKRALAFQDDDWYTMNTGQHKAYTNVVTVSDKETTTASNYRARLKEGYEAVLVCTHSSPTVHTFKASTGTSYFRNTELWSMAPPGLFFNLFACSNCRFTSTRYMGGCYIFNKSSPGIIAIGSTKTGSMLYFSDYYSALQRKDCFGEAFRYWFDRRYPYSASDISWFYGMTLLGDPTLRLGTPGEITSYGQGCPGTGKVTGVQTVIPTAYAKQWGETRTALPLGWYDNRLQQVYGTSSVPAKFTANGIAFRHDESEVRSINSYSINLSVDIGLSPNSPASMSTTFAANISGTPTTVLKQKKVNLPYWTTTNSSTDNWLIKIPFDSPLAYTAQSGKYLLLDCKRSNASTGTNYAYYWVDAVSSSSNAVSRVYAQGLTATTGSLAVGFGSVVGFTQPATGGAVPILASTSVPVIGGEVALELTRARALTATGLVLGFSDSKWGGFNLPMDLAGLGAPGCSLRASFDLLLIGTTNSTGSQLSKLPIPNDPVLLKGILYLQTIIADPGANKLGVAVTNGLKAVVGGNQ